MKHLDAVLVLPHLSVENANATASSLTHGFPSITAFVGLMWALERKLSSQDVALRMQGIGVICHQHQEHSTQGFVRSFKLPRGPLDKHGEPSPIVEQGRMHLQITLVIGVSEKSVLKQSASLGQASQAQLAEWAQKAGRTLAGMRVAGGTVVPAAPAPCKRTQPWIEPLSEDPRVAACAMRRWRRQWLPGYALVGRDDLLAMRLQRLQSEDPSATLVDAWLHASRLNMQAQPRADGTQPPHGKVTWSDPWRPSDDSWVVPIPVGYASLIGRPLGAGEVLNARDDSTPFDMVESVYSLGQWVSPLQLDNIHQLLWLPEHDEKLGLYRCRNQFESWVQPIDQPPASTKQRSPLTFSSRKAPHRPI